MAIHDHRAEAAMVDLTSEELHQTTVALAARRDHLTTIANQWELMYGKDSPATKDLHQAALTCDAARLKVVNAWTALRMEIGSDGRD